MLKRLIKKCIAILENILPCRRQMLINNQYLKYILTYLEEQLYSEENDFRHVSVLVQELERYIDRKEQAVMLDVGSRDAQVAILLKRYFPNAKAYAFECNPVAIELCRNNITRSGLKDVVLVGKAISDMQGKTDFYAVDQKRLENIGASSLFPATPDNPEGTRDAQYKIEVDSVTLQQWAEENNLKTIDLLFMDLQGAELKALRGLGKLISQVKFIYTEVEYKELYVGQALFPEVDRYLAEHNFRIHRQMYIRNKYYGNILYVNNAI